MKKFQIPKGKREYYFVLLLGFTLVVLVISISYILFTQPQQSQTTTTVQLTSPTPITQSVFQPNTQLKYNPVASRTLLHREQQRTPLSSPDAQAKARILQLLPVGQNYGTVYSTPNIIIEYVQSLDLFQVEVLTVNVAQAKNEAEEWFKQEGMSQQGICDLPLGFYPSWDTATILKDNNFIFNELPDGC